MLDEESFPQYYCSHSLKILIGSLDLINVNLTDIINKEGADDHKYITQEQHAAIGFHLSACGLLAEQAYRNYGDAEREKILKLEIVNDLKLGGINSLIKNNIRDTLSEVINTNQMLVSNLEQSASIEPYDMPMGSELAGFKNVISNIKSALCVCLEVLTMDSIQEE